MTKDISIFSNRCLVDGRPVLNIVNNGDYPKISEFGIVKSIES